MGASCRTAAELTGALGVIKLASFHMTRRCFSVASVALVLCAAVVPVGAQVVGQAPAVLKVSIDSSYSTPMSAEQIALFADLNIARIVTVPAQGVDSTISGVILREYGFGAADRLAAYSAMVAAILRLNSLGAPTELQPGLLRIPNLPRIGYAANAPIATAALQTTVLPEFIREGLRQSTGMLIDTATEIADPQGGGTTTTMFEVPLPSTALLTNAGRTLAAASYSVVYGLQLSVAVPERYADAPAANPLGAAAMTGQVQSFLNRPAPRQVDLFVLDSGWPQTEFGRSIDRLRDLVDAAGKNYAIRADRSSLNFTPAKNPHCEQIVEALHPFRSADRFDAVRVIYVPLTRDQGAARLLTEFIHVSLMLQSERLLSRGSTVPITPAEMKRQLSKTARQAVEVVKNLPADATSNPFITDQALIDAIFNVAHAVAQANDRFFVVNQSWTVPSGAVVFKPLDAQRAVAVAAAGNQSRRDIYQDPLVNFAGQSKTSSYVVAVLNMDAKGELVCNSSTISVNFLNDVQATGYNGQINGDCGTSFAAPRVAWLIAAQEALRKGLIAPTDWPLKLKHSLRNSRTGSGVPGLLLDVTKFLSLAN